MANLEIVLYPHEVLTRTSRELEVGEVKTEKFRRLVSEMYAAMYRLGGIGLAAPQVGVSVRLIVLNPTGKRDFHSDAAMCLINPTLVPMGGEKELVEGCLSIPGIYSKVTRADLIHVKTLDVRGIEHTFQVDGIISRIIQHELDHLEGLTFLDRLNEQSRIDIQPQIEEHLRKVEVIRKIQEEERRTKEAKEKKRQKDKLRLEKKRRGNHGNW